MFFLFPAILFFSGCNQSQQQETARDITGTVSQNWQWLPFQKVDSLNPVLTPSDSMTFNCPIRGEIVRWEEKDVFNPAAVNRDQKIYLIYRAEDVVGKYAGTSRLGLAVSTDGLHFIKMKDPVFYPDHDHMKPFEWEGGCEDPRIVESESGKYILTYTAWDGETARLAVASSGDLLKWEKHGLAFAEYRDGKYRDLWSKSGSIVSRKSGHQLIAVRINGRYWMYWGDTHIYLAYSDDLFHWVPLEGDDGNLKAVFSPRKGYFDSDLVEPGPPAIMTDNGIWMIYNSRNHPENGEPQLPPGTYAAGQILFDVRDPSKVIARSETDFFHPENDYEITGQVGNVCFLEGLAPLGKRWFLYYGTADSKIAAAVYEPGP
ncbi:MAG: glycosidase [Cyclobacteriaceae bacterium]|nr:glycosidase [Cyclobacteriaceae bacterium]